jgi:hypothetical protein
MIPTWFICFASFSLLHLVYPRDRDKAIEIAKMAAVRRHSPGRNSPLPASRWPRIRDRDASRKKALYVRDANNRDASRNQSVGPRRPCSSLGVSQNGVCRIAHEVLSRRPGRPSVRVAAAPRR